MHWEELEDALAGRFTLNDGTHVVGIVWATDEKPYIEFFADSGDLVSVAAQSEKLGRLDDFIDDIQQYKLDFGHFEVVSMGGVGEQFIENGLPVNSFFIRGADKHSDFFYTYGGRESSNVYFTRRCSIRVGRFCTSFFQSGLVQR